MAEAWERDTATVTLLTHKPGGRGPAPPGGPHAIIQGLVAGLNAIGADWQLDPPQSRLVPRLRGHVGVFHGLDTLRWAVRRRRSIDWLVSGPFHVLHPDDFKFDWAVADVIVTLSNWNRDVWCDGRPELADRIRVWSAGVDTDHWVRGGGKTFDVLIYHKSRDAPLLAEVEKAVERAGLSARTIHYGAHTSDEYKALLQEARAMVFLSLSETQGLVLFEAWASDVPTLVWDRRLWTHRNAPLSAPASSAPYLTDQTGMRFSGAEDLPDRLHEFWTHLASFSPREWVLAGHTLEHAARRYLDLFTRS